MRSGQAGMSQNAKRRPLHSRWQTPGLACQSRCADAPAESRGAKAIALKADFIQRPDYPALLAEVERQLIKARLGQDRWRQMHLVLTSNPTGSLYPLDFCPELSAEVVAFYKQEDWFDFPQAPSLDTCNVLADMLALGPTGEIFVQYELKRVNAQLRYFAKKIDTLEATRKALADALPL